MFKLAFGLKMTVGELENRMSYVELMEWVQFYKIEPWGDPWRMAAMQAATKAT